MSDFPFIVKVLLICIAGGMVLMAAGAFMEAAYMKERRRHTKYVRDKFTDAEVDRICREIERREAAHEDW